MNSPVTDRHTDSSIKEELLRWALSAVTVLVAYMLLAWIVTQVYHPDIDAILREAKELLIYGDTSPEPVESMLFRLGVFTIIPGLLGAYALYSRSSIIKKLSSGNAWLIISLLCAAAVIVLLYAGLTAPNPFGTEAGSPAAKNVRDRVGGSNFHFYFADLFLGEYWGLYLLIILPLVACLFFIGLRNKRWEESKKFNAGINVAGYLLSAAILAAIFAMNTFRWPYAYQNKYDFNAVYFSMTQVFAGKPMLVDHFTNTYGLYPHFLMPIFKITGLSILTFSGVMALLATISFAFNFYVLRQFTRSNVILFLGFITVIFFPYFNFKLTTPFDSVFSFYAIRYIIPSTLTFLTVLYLNRPTRLFYFIITILMAFFILWNPEFGLVCYLSWVATNMYKDVYTTEGKIAWKQLAFYPVSALAVACLVVYAYKFLILLIYGTAPDLGAVFSTIIVFSRLGFGLLPMSLIHPWNIIVLILVSGMLYSMVHLYRKTITNRSIIIFLVSLIGIGYMVYFQGRSHNSNFAMSTGFALILLTLLGDELWQTVKKHNILPLNVFFTLFLFLISFSLVETICSAGKIVDMISQEEDKELQLVEQGHIERNRDFVVRNTGDHEKIFMLTTLTLEGLFYDENTLQSAFTPGLEDLFLKSDINRMTNIIRDSSFSIFLEPDWVTRHPFYTVPLAELSASYEYKYHSETIYRLDKRKVKIPLQTFFTPGDSVIVHRKYTDDTTSLRLRATDAAGIKNITLAPSFSVEVLFYSSQQMFPGATLAGNTQDSSGFVIGNVVNSSKYFFWVYGRGAAYNLSSKQWHYCVLNAFPDHMDIYDNGTLLGSMELGNPVNVSVAPLAIGNLGKFHNFIGAIAEVSVANKTIDKMRMDSTWQSIRSAMGL